MKKLNDYSETEQREIESQVDAFSSMVAGGAYDWEVAKAHVEADSYGVCNKCTNLLLTVFEYGKKYAYCDKWKKFLEENKRIKDCSSFNEKGRMSLYDMKQIAVIIDPSDKEVGFLK